MSFKKHWEGTILPDKLDNDTIYKLTPKDFSIDFYHERTDRNIGWITPEEQDMLRNMTVGVAGCGGMGGLVASILIRLGVGTVKIADSEDFDISNINRQFGATKKTVGKSKAFATARAIRAISDDTTVKIYPKGVQEDTVDDFVDGCDIICDMIEFWAVGSRILLHQQARKQKTRILNCDSVGHRTYIFNFTHDAMCIEDALGFEYEQAKQLQSKIEAGQASDDEIKQVMDAVLKVFAPEIPDYGAKTREVFLERLFNEQKASIIATNPPMASGFLTNYILFYLLENSGTNRNFTKIPEFPGHLGFDAADMKTFESFTDK